MNSFFLWVNARNTLWTYNSASGCRIEKRVFVLDVEVGQMFLLKRGSEKLLLRFDDIFVHPEESTEPVESWLSGFQVIVLQGQFDVHNLGVCAQHFPRCMHLHKNKSLIQNLRWKNIENKNASKELLILTILELCRIFFLFTTHRWPTQSCIHCPSQYITGFSKSTDMRKHPGKWRHKKV